MGGRRLGSEGKSLGGSVGVKEGVCAESAALGGGAAVPWGREKAGGAVKSQGLHLKMEPLFQV